MQSVGKIKLLIIEESKRNINHITSLINLNFSNIEIVSILDDIEDISMISNILAVDVLLVNYDLVGEMSKPIFKNIRNFDIPVIFFSDNASQAQTAIKFSPIDYLINPIKAIDLSIAISKLNY